MLYVSVKVLVVFTNIWQQSSEHAN